MKPIVYVVVSKYLYDKRSTVEGVFSSWDLADKRRDVLCYELSLDEYDIEIEEHEINA